MVPFDPQSGTMAYGMADSQPERKPLVIRGARQVGKSTLVRQLAAGVPLALVELNFERNPGRLWEVQWWDRRGGS